MEKVYITNLFIEKLRHLNQVQIPLSKNEMKHLIFTGKNGSGKTSVLDAIAGFLDTELSKGESLNSEQILAEELLEGGWDLNSSNIIKASSAERIAALNRFYRYWNYVKALGRGIHITLRYPMKEIRPKYHMGEFVVAYYKADRVFQTEIPKHIEKVEWKDYYSITETPRQDFVKYLLDLKMTEALAASSGKVERADKIRNWFQKFEELLGEIFEDDSLKLEFDEETFQFTIHETGREPFDFNSLSSGYAAILDIVVDLMIRMERQTDKKFCFDIPGIVLIDEIETHLHLELQRNILPFLTKMFPNVQFVISTHSPFILNSLDNVVVYDLENHLLVEHGLTDIPYDGIVEGYFRVDSMSALLKGKFERYKALTEKHALVDQDFEEIAKLELFLDEIPDYLALDIATEYKKRKREFESREDI